MTLDTITDALILSTSGPLLYAALRAHHHFTTTTSKKGHTK